LKHNYRVNSVTVIKSQPILIVKTNAVTHYNESLNGLNINTLAHRL